MYRQMENSMDRRLGDSLEKCITTDRVCRGCRTLLPASAFYDKGKKVEFCKGCITDKKGAHGARKRAFRI